MHTSFWIALGIQENKYGQVSNNSVKITKSKPSTKANEIAFHLAMEIPDSFFKTPHLSAKIIIPDHQVNAPTITSEIKENISQAIAEQIGTKIRLSFDAPKDEE